MNVFTIRGNAWVAMKSSIFFSFFSVLVFFGSLAGSGQQSMTIDSIDSPDALATRQTLKSCITSNMADSAHHSLSAKETARYFCPKESRAFIDACAANFIAKFPADSSDPYDDDDRRPQCQLYMDVLFNGAIDKQWRISHPEPPVRTNPLEDAAIKDFQTHAPLPGLPNLDRPVYLKSGAVVCDTSGELVNQNRAIMLGMKFCVVITRPIRVVVSLPTSPMDYLRQHIEGNILVVLPAAGMSVANSNMAWAMIADLKN